MEKILSFKVALIVFLISFIFVYGTSNPNDVSSDVSNRAKEGPFMKDPNLQVQEYSAGFDFPSGMAFLGPDEVLITEKNTGKVKEIKNGTLTGTILDVNVSNTGERGLLGIAVSKQVRNDNDNTQSVSVFLYYTESEDFDGGKVLVNRLYRFDLVDDKLINPKLLLDLPSSPGIVHNGGKILVGPDNNLFITVGDIGARKANGSTKTINDENGGDADGRAGVLRISQNGKAVNGGILGKNHPLDRYFAYGIRNSFGIAFDPITGNLWDTENGQRFGDEINLVEPGFNSGWNIVQGIWQALGQGNGSVLANTDHLVKFHGKGMYSPPKFVWENVTGPTEVVFLDSNNLGKDYENDMFVGDFHNGYLYHFNLNNKRTDLHLDPPLEDKVARTNDDLQEVISGRGFGGITDLEVGPDGYLYILSTYLGGDDCGDNPNKSSCFPYSSSNVGNIFRIVPALEKLENR